ncbi:MAG: hypothetical protein ABI747_00675 [Candidatus Moraniibacteriota bacterium]
MKFFHFETGFVLILLLLLLALVNPFSLWMPEQFEMICTGLVLIFFILFTVYLLREKPRDEREELHHFIAARLAYLVGAGVLVVGIVIQTFMHHLTFWLPLALGGMLLGKLCGKWYAERHY